MGSERCFGGGVRGFVVVAFWNNNGAGRDWRALSSRGTTKSAISPHRGESENQSQRSWCVQVVYIPCVTLGVELGLCYSIVLWKMIDAGIAMSSSSRSGACKSQCMVGDYRSGHVN